LNYGAYSLVYFKIVVFFFSDFLLPPKAEIDTEGKVLSFIVEVMNLEALLCVRKDSTPAFLF